MNSINTAINNNKNSNHSGVTTRSSSSSSVINKPVQLPADHDRNHRQATRLMRRNPLTNRSIKAIHFLHNMVLLKMKMHGIQNKIQYYPVDHKKKWMKPVSMGYMDETSSYDYINCCVGIFMSFGFVVN